MNQAGISIPGLGRAKAAGIEVVNFTIGRRPLTC